MGDWHNGTVTVHLQLDEARRLAVQAQLLDSPRPTDLVEIVQHLTFLKVDPTAAVAPSADLVLWSRIGSGYRPAQLQGAIEHDRDLFEFNNVIRPMDALPLYLAGSEERPRYASTHEWFEDNETFRQDILDLLGDAGPLLSRDIPDTSLVSWPSTGWTNNRNVTQMLEILLVRGEIAVSHRKGRERFWDLAERVYPPLPRMTREDASIERRRRRLRSLGIARATGPGMPVEPTTVGEAGVEATVEGVPGVWRVDPDALGKPFTGRTALLSPLDLLVYDRKRMEQLWGFDYILEMYKPAKDRKWGYFALPILHHERLVGKVDVIADRKARRYVVNAIHEDEPFTKAMTAAVEAELQDLATWQGLELAHP